MFMQNTDKISLISKAYEIDLSKIRRFNIKIY